MTPFVADPDFVLYVGDVFEVLRALPDESVDCCATSPPFYGLRDYEMDGQIGLEATVEEWVSRLVSVFAEVRRGLRPHGTLWVECGDSYSSSGPPGFTGLDKSTLTGGYKAARAKLNDSHHGFRRVPSLAPKQLVGQPWRLALALQADGWWLRQCIVWHKPNAMPESAKDRCTTGHSYLFLLSKQPRYFFDATAISEPAEWARWGDQTVPKYEGTDTASGWMQPKTKSEIMRDRADGFKHPRSVWTIPTQGYSGAHFATWPEALVERIIRAATSEHGVCSSCGAPWVRATEPVGDYADALAEETRASGGLAYGRGGQGPTRKSRTTTTTGYATCECGAAPVPAVVLDPFMGSGTTALVSRRLGRWSIGIELNPEYAALAARRLSQQSLLAEATG